jgi:hypothetical protein
MTDKKNLWILTEERPKKEVLQIILQYFAKDYALAAFINPLHILPILENNNFTFIYEVTGFLCNKINKVFIKTISGYSSFVDFLIFIKNNNLLLTIYLFMLLKKQKLMTKNRVIRVFISVVQNSFLSNSIILMLKK